MKQVAFALTIALLLVLGVEVSAAKERALRYRGKRKMESIDKGIFKRAPNISDDEMGKRPKNEGRSFGRKRRHSQ